MATDSGREDALVALALVAGVVDGNEAADAMIVEAFHDGGHAARAHAYLSGFLLQALADQRGEEPSQTVIWVRSLVKRV